VIGETPAVVLVVDQQNQVVDYRIEPLSDVVAELHLKGFGERIEISRVVG
jgi:hypothetical protein